MGKNNKKRKAERRLLAQQFHQQLSEIKDQSLEQKKRSKLKISGSVAIPTIEEELVQKINDSTYSLIFEYYNDNICGIPDISSGVEAKKIISIFKSISKSTPQDIKDIIHDTVRKEEAKNEYKKLFNGLPEDIDLVHEASFSSKGRLFFFTVPGTHNFACMISINPRHLT